MARRDHQAVMEKAATLFAASQSNTVDPAELNVWLDADPAHAAAWARVESAWERADRLRALPLEPHSRPAFEPTRRWAAGLLLAALGGGAGVTWAVRRQSVEGTRLGQQRQVALEDGSRIELNTDSKIRIAYTEGERRIFLIRGEALFDVAKDTARPFIVSANGAEVRAVGTAFNIRLRDHLVELTVTEGVVAVDEAPGAAGPTRVIRQLEQGKGAVIATDAIAEVPLDAEAMQRRLAWREGVIELEGETLEQAVAEFNRYNGDKLVIADPKVAAIRVGGRFGVHELAEFVAAVEKGFPVRAVAGERGALYFVGTTMPSA